MAGPIYLFVGGALDGKWRESAEKPLFIKVRSLPSASEMLDVSLAVQRRPMAPSDLREETYRLEELRIGPAPVIWYYVLDRMSPEEALITLVENYKRP